ncbi:MED6-domain-containing protein [Dentipellis sp. KUC8613]|nr:MED6-domain-containing protein [Dentipellis sp. KUC8613]
MDLNDLHPIDDYSHRFFIWHEWIQANGPLTAENVFDYFATSMFYDKQSNNQVLRMQTMHTGMPIANEAEELRRFTGVEFAVVHAEPPSFFIIHKRERISPDEARPMAAYFIMNNRIYQSPDVYTVLSNRLLTSLNSLQSSLDILRKYKPDYTPRTGFVWPVAESSEEITKKRRSEDAVDIVESQSDMGASAEKDEKTAPGAPKKLQNTALLFNAMRTTAAHSNKVFSLNIPAAVGPESSTAETPGTATIARSSATPAPQSATLSSSQGTVPASQDPIPNRAPSGAGKRKKKRMSIPAPPTAAS